VVAEGAGEEVIGVERLELGESVEESTLYAAPSRGHVSQIAINRRFALFVIGRLSVRDF
jgi:hypothetical protein